MMYDDAKDLANTTPAFDRERPEVPHPILLLGGTTDEADTIHNENPEHNRFLYASLYRPLGMWFKPEIEHSQIAGTAHWSVFGTSEPLGLDLLNSYQLVPVESSTLAASTLRALEEEDGPRHLAGVDGDSYSGDGITVARVLTSIPEHKRPFSVITFRPDVGPTGHMCYRDTPADEIGTGTLYEGVKRIARMEEVIRPDTADYIISDWIAEAEHMADALSAA